MSEPKKGAAAAPAAATVETTTQVSLLDQIVEKGRFGEEPAAQQRGRDLITGFLEEVMKGEVTPSRDAEQMINARIAQVDHLISQQINEVLHHASFQKLEASWRGLKYVLDNSEMTPLLKVRVLNASKKEVLRDLQRAPEFDQSALFRKVYEEEYGVFGGEPFGALIGDFEFTKHPEDIELLDKISHVAAAAHAPFLTSAGPEMLSLDNFANLGAPRDIGRIFDSTEFAKWKGFRESEDSRYVGLCLPHILLRLPYGKDSKTVDGFDYEENVDGTDHSKYLWGNAAYALGTRLTMPFLYMAGAPPFAASKAAVWWRICPPIISVPTKATWLSNAPPKSLLRSARKRTG
jgi:type VI secretion system protein ImpC